MNTSVADSHAPGLLVRTLGLVHSGVRRTQTQIPAYAAAWSAEAEDAERSSLPPWVALGDSLSQGIGASAYDRGFVGQLRDRLAAEGRARAVVNLSRSGARIQDVIDEQLPRLGELSRRPVLITCTVGSNDLLRSLRIGKSLARLGLLVEALPAGTILATVPANGSAGAKYFNSGLRRHADAVGLRVADVAEHFIAQRDAISGDGFHPSDAGYAAWVAAFASVLPA